MKKMLFAFAMLFSIQAFCSIFSMKNNEQIDRVAKKEKNTADEVAFAKEMLTKDVSKMSYDELKALFVKNLGNEKYQRPFFECIMKVEKYKKFQKDALAKDSDCLTVKYYFPMFVDKSLYGNTENYRKALVAGIVYSAQKQVRERAERGVKKYEELMSELKEDQIIADLKLIKRYIYPKMNINEKWKQLATKVELLIRANQ